MICLMCAIDESTVCIYVKHPNLLSIIKSLDLCEDCFSVIWKQEYWITKISSLKEKVNMFD